MSGGEIQRSHPSTDSRNSIIGANLISYRQPPWRSRTLEPDDIPKPHPMPLEKIGGNRHNISSRKPLRKISLPLRPHGGLHGQKSPGRERINPHYMQRLPGKIGQGDHPLDQRGCGGHPGTCLDGRKQHLGKTPPDFQVRPSGDHGKCPVETFHGTSVGNGDGEENAHPQPDAKDAE